MRFHQRVGTLDAGNHQLVTREAQQMHVVHFWDLRDRLAARGVEKRSPQRLVAA